MITVHVVILLVVLCSATAAESGSGAVSGSGGDDRDYGTGKDNTTIIEEEVKKEPLQSGDSDFSSDVDRIIEGFSATGMEQSDTSNHIKNQHPAPLSTQPTFYPWNKKAEKTQTMHLKEQSNFSTLTAIENPEKSFDPTIRLDFQNSKKKIRRKDNVLRKRPRMDPKILPREKLLKAENRSKHKHKERRYEYRRGPTRNNTKYSHIEFAQVNKVIDEMEKLKKSKTDEELAKKIRKGARQVMSSIAKSIATKTTQTLTPHFDHLFQSNQKKDHENEAVTISFLPKNTTKEKRKDVLFHNNTQSNQIQQRADRALNQDSKMLKTKTEEKKTAKHDDLQNGINVHLSGVPFNSSVKKGEKNAEFMKQSNVLKEATVTRNVKRNERQNQKQDQDSGLQISGKQRSKENQSDTNKNGKQRNAATHVDSNFNSHGNSVGVKVFLKAPAKLKDKRLSSIREYKFMNKRTELMNTPTTPSSMLTSSRNNNDYKPHQYLQGVLPADGVSKNQVKMLQDKVNHLETEVTVLQTAVAGLVHRINNMERSFQEVSNVTQNEVIYGSTQASTATTTSPSHSIGSTQKATSIFPSFSRQYYGTMLPTQQSTPTSRSINNQLLSPGMFLESMRALQTRRQKPVIVRPSTMPTSFIQQLQVEELPAKQHLTSAKSSPFPEPFLMKASSVAENVHKQPLATEKLKDSRHKVHQIIIPLDTLYKMQAQEGKQVPANSYGESRDLDEGNIMSIHSNTMLKDKTKTFQTPVNQHQQYLGMDTTQDGHSSEPRVRPIVNIIVPNSQTASILEKEMCWTPCKNGGKCNGSNTCQCPFPFYGNQCERFSLYDFINEKAKKWSVNSMKRNSLPSENLQQVLLKDLMRPGAKIRLANGRSGV